MFVLLIAASSALAVFTQPINTLLLGVGGLLLATWGVRAVLMPVSLPVITAVDLALSGVILLLLLGLATRISIYLHRRSGFGSSSPKKRQGVCPETRRWPGTENLRNYRPDGQQRRS